MWQTIFYFVLKVTVGVIGWIAYAWIEQMAKKKNITMSRIFDTLPTAEQKNHLKAALSYAKAEIDELDLPDDPVEYAVGYGEFYLLEEEDFSLLTVVEIGNVVSWVGPRPPHRPKVW